MDVIRGELFTGLAGDRIVYCHTHDVNKLFKTYRGTKDIILISHNSDGKVIAEGQTFPNANASVIPSWVRHWYAQNVCIYNPKITSIPIGLENSYIPNANQKLEKIMSKSKETRKPRNLVYMNHAVSTNKVEREPPYTILGNKPYVTAHHGRNGVDYDRYIDNVANHQFVICPEGNGTDTHRTWETLYLGSIPIEKRNPNNSHYTDLPICFVSSWEEVTESFLMNELARISSMPTNLGKLTFSYWRSRILEHAEHL